MWQKWNYFKKRLHVTINLMQRRTIRGCGEAVIKGGNGQLVAKVELL